MTHDLDARVSVTPVTPVAFHILLALATGERHGYAIMDATALSAGTVYRMIKHLVAGGRWNPPAPPPPPRGGPWPRPRRDDSRGSSDTRARCFSRGEAARARVTRSTMRRRRCIGASHEPRGRPQGRPQTARSR